MSKLGHSGKLVKEFILFAKVNKTYWIIPLMMTLLLLGLLAMTTQATTPFIYTLF